MSSAHPGGGHVRGQLPPADGTEEDEDVRNVRARPGDSCGRVSISRFTVRQPRKEEV